MVMGLTLSQSFTANATGTLTGVELAMSSLDTSRTCGTLNNHLLRTLFLAVGSNELLQLSDSDLARGSAHAFC